MKIEKKYAGETRLHRFKIIGLSCENGFAQNDATVPKRNQITQLMDSEFADDEAEIIRKIRVKEHSGRSRQYVSLLRQELTTLNNSFAAANHLAHVTTYGELPIVVYSESECGRQHGNFIPSSYRAILRRPQWRRRLQKVYSSARHSLPARDGRWRELDSSLSSDALLMNIFCYPGVTRRIEVCRLLGINPGSIPDFGFMPRIPLRTRAIERTEIDMKLGDMLFESKLIEADFQVQRAELVEQYRDFQEVFECGLLPRAQTKYVSYQLIRHILAAHALGFELCLLLDVRRPDLLESWYRIVRCVRCADLRARCKILTWQELSCCLPKLLQNFLEAKYGILPAAPLNGSPAP